VQGRDRKTRVCESHFSQKLKWGGERRGGGFIKKFRSALTKRANVRRDEKRDEKSLQKRKKRKRVMWASPKKGRKKKAAAPSKERVAGCQLVRRKGEFPTEGRREVKREKKGQNELRGEGVRKRGMFTKLQKKRGGNKKKTKRWGSKTFKDD